MAEYYLMSPFSWIYSPSAFSSLVDIQIEKVNFFRDAIHYFNPIRDPIHFFNSTYPFRLSIVRYFHTGSANFLENWNESIFLLQRTFWARALHCPLWTIKLQQLEAVITPLVFMSIFFCRFTFFVREQLIELSTCSDTHTEHECLQFLPIRTWKPKMSNHSKKIIHIQIIHFSKVWMLESQSSPSSI